MDYKHRKSIISRHREAKITEKSYKPSGFKDIKSYKSQSKEPDSNLIRLKQSQGVRKAKVSLSPMPWDKD